MGFLNPALFSMCLRGNDQKASVKKVRLHSPTHWAVLPYGHFGFLFQTCILPQFIGYSTCLVIDIIEFTVSLVLHGVLKCFEGAYVYTYICTLHVI